MGVAAHFANQWLAFPGSGAWADVRYARDLRIFAAEKEARAAGRVLWSVGGSGSAVRLLSILSRPIKFEVDLPPLNSGAW